MILKETILSAFTERGTLLKWLKKVEAALNNAVLTDISVEQISETQVKLKFTFENGDFIESPVLTLPRGEKGEKGEDGKDGKDGLDGEGISATIEIGTVTTGAAGTNASVTNVGTEQRAILNFVIPRGANGEQGSAGVGFDDATRIEQNSGTNTLTAGANGLSIAATFKVTAGDEVFEIPSSMFLAVKGSESIVIDVDESGTFFDIHLDADITTKLQRVLVTPTTAPASISLVAVDTSNAQTLLTLGDGLSVSGGVLSASGGGGGGGGASINTDTMFSINISAPTVNLSKWLILSFVDGDGVYYPVYRNTLGRSGKAMGFIVTASVPSTEYDIPSDKICTASGTPLSSISDLNDHLNEVIFLKDDFDWYAGN